MGGWIDDDSDAQWIVLSGDESDEFIEDEFGYLDFDDDSIWDEIMTNIKTLKGRPLNKKCMNIFGRQLCICEFMDWLHGKTIGGNTKHICYSPQYKGAAITKKTMAKQKQKQAKAKKVAMMKKKKKMKKEKQKKLLKKKKLQNK